MKTHEILFEHPGENALIAKSPIAVWNEQVDLTTKIRGCRSWDDDGFTLVDRYAVLEVELPDWLTPEEWIRSEVHFRFAFSYTGKEAEESLVRWFAYGELPEERKNAIMKLLKTKTFRSSFRESLQKQVLQWLHTSPEDRKFDSPLSPKQWSSLVTVHDLPRGDRRRFYSVV